MECRIGLKEFLLVFVKVIISLLMMAILSSIRNKIMDRLSISDLFRKLYILCYVDIRRSLLGKTVLFLH